LGNKKNGVTLDSFLTETASCLVIVTIYREVSVMKLLATYQIKLVSGTDKGYRLIGHAIAFQIYKKTLYLSSKELPFQTTPKSISHSTTIKLKKKVKMEALAIDFFR